jgi:hypothetical protein
VRIGIGVELDWHMHPPVVFFGVLGSEPETLAQSWQISAQYTEDPRSFNIHHLLGRMLLTIPQAASQWRSSNSQSVYLSPSWGGTNNLDIF